MSLASTHPLPNVLSAVCAAALSMALFLPCTACAEIKLGILPRLGPVELFTMFNPLAEYLSRETGQKVSIVIPKDFAAFKRAVQENNFELAFANPLIYVQLRQELPVRPLAVAAEPRAGSRFRGVVICRKDSSLHALQDLKGKKLIFVDKDSAGGYLFQMLLLSRAGVGRGDITFLPFGKKHDNVLQAVLNGVADAGGIREDDLDKFKTKGDASQIRILGYTDYFPNWPVFAAPGLDRDVAAKITAALKRLQPNSEKARTLLRSAGLIGFEPVTDEDYEQLRQAARLVGAL